MRVRRLETVVQYSVTINDPDGNIIGLIDNSTGGMPGQAPG